MAPAPRSPTFRSPRRSRPSPTSSTRSTTPGAWRPRTCRTSRILNYCKGDAGTTACAVSRNGAGAGGNFYDPPFWASDFNHLAYDPNVVYQPPLKADKLPLTNNVGTVTDALGNQNAAGTMAKIQSDPYLSAATTVNLSGTVVVPLYCNSDWPLDLTIGANAQYDVHEGQGLPHQRHEVRPDRHVAGSGRRLQLSVAVQHGAGRVGGAVFLLAGRHQADLVQPCGRRLAHGDLHHVLPGRCADRHQHSADVDTYRQHQYVLHRRRRAGRRMYGRIDVLARQSATRARSIARRAWASRASARRAALQHAGHGPQRHVQLRRPDERPHHRHRQQELHAGRRLHGNVLQRQRDDGLHRRKPQH